MNKLQLTVSSLAKYFYAGRRRSVISYWHAPAAMRIPWTKLLLAALLAPLPLAAQVGVSYPIDGRSAGDLFGESLACFDGYLVVGEPGESSVGPGFGRVQIYSGIPGTLAINLPMPGGAPISNEHFGQSVAVLGDVDSNSSTDLMVGAPGWLYGLGAAFIYTNFANPPSVTLYGSQSGENFGSVVVTVGDLTGDGLPEYAIAAPRRFISATDDGAVVVFNAATNGIINTFAGSNQEKLGSSLAKIGDLNGDGLNDLAAGAPQSAGGGRVAVLSPESGTVITSILGGSVTNSFGAAVAAVDLNADGLEDLIVGSPSSLGGDAGSGSVFVYSGAAITKPASRLLCSIDGSEFGSKFGSAVAAVGDLNGDGLADFAVGAPNTSDVPGQTNALHQGAFAIYSYNPFTASCERIGVIEGFNSIGYQHGSSFAGQCDLNSDGRTDLAVGAISPVNGLDTGSVHLYPGPVINFPSFGPNRADLRFRVRRNGQLRVRVVYDQSPAGLCTLKILARTQVGSRISDIFEVTDSVPTLAEQSFIALRMPRAAKVNGRRPILHLMAETSCTQRSFDSNVFARYIDCGAGAGVDTGLWLGTLRKKIQVIP